MTTSKSCTDESSNNFLSPKANGRGVEFIELVAETPGWQLQRNKAPYRYGVWFKVVDVRERWRVSPDKPLRHVWNISYNPKRGTIGGDADVLREHYPEIAQWAKERITSHV